MPSRLSQSTRLSSLCYTAASHQVSVSNIVAYTWQCYFLNLTHPLLLPAQCPQVHSLVLGPHCFLQIVKSVLFFSKFHIYALIYSICFSLCELLHPHIISSSFSLQLIQICSFSWPCNISLYVRGCTLFLLNCNYLLIRYIYLLGIENPLEA